MDLTTPIKDAGRVFAMYARRLEKLEITTVSDLLYHIPFRYEDYRLLSPINKLQAGEVVTIRGTVHEIQNIFTKRFKNLQKAVIADETGEIEVTWFNQPFLLRNIQKGDTIAISGKVETFGNKLTIIPSEYEVLGGNQIHTGRLVPIYPETRAVSSKWFRNRIAYLLDVLLPHMEEYFPPALEEYNLMDLAFALRSIHFPQTHEQATQARDRLSFDELFLMQLAGLKRRSDWEKTLIGHSFKIAAFRKEITSFWERLSFELTNAQKRAVKDIFKDLASKKPMNRLLEGDVGSGKTVVSAIAMYLAFLNGFQSVLMAPTEILAQQHFETISTLLSLSGIKVELVTGSRKPKSYSLNPDVLIGTHTLLSKKIELDKLGLVVIDEQQRFGVEQRAIIRRKGHNPHLLTMTATPIPRTVALTMYGDLDLSFLDEMPKGRKKVKTWLVPLKKRVSAYVWIEKQIKEENVQAFVICPFIEQSETLQTVRAATKEHERLKKEVYPNLRLGLLHGRLKAKEKKQVLQDFRDQKLDILVATPVVEVGIDIPNATIIVIEGAERFGLAQLHQLRGRVGRGEKQSYCLLFTESRGELTLRRLKAMETMHVGARLSELDLKLRGPGEMYGTLQHGARSLKIASFSDFPLIEKTRKAAEHFFPNLARFPLLQLKLKSLTIKEVAPD